MTKGETLAWMIQVSRPLATRFFAGFDDSNRAAQAPGLPNHFAWTLGHCGLTMHRMAGMLDAGALPEVDYVEGTEFAQGSPPDAFGTEGVSFGSKPIDDAAHYPTAARCVSVFDAACDRLENAARHATDEQLAAMHQWGNQAYPAADLVARMVSHNAMHAGQLVDLRRALGFAPVIG